MELINRVKLRLEKFIGNKADKSIVKPIKIIEENGKYYLILKKINLPNSYLFARSLDGFDFDLLENFEKSDNFIYKFNSTAAVSDFTIRNKKQLINSTNPAEIGGAFLFPRASFQWGNPSITDKFINCFKPLNPIGVGQKLCCQNS